MSMYDANEDNVYNVFLLIIEVLFVDHGLFLFSCGCDDSNKWPVIVVIGREMGKFDFYCELYSKLDQNLIHLNLFKAIY